MTAAEPSSAREAPQAPGWGRLTLEVRAPFEFFASALAAPWLARAPRGDGHPVIVYPGFLASDFSTRPMRRLLRWLGHDVRGWSLGRNLRPTAPLLDEALARVRQVHAQTGRRVSLVGWSLGGIYARELAKRVPEAVRAVVTLGSPFGGPARSTRAHRLFQRVNRDRPVLSMSAETLRQPPEVPTTSIYSRSDGIVAWQISLEADGAASESIRVPASHLGLGVNPWALYALADRLAQPEGQWRPFRRQGLGRPFFPRHREPVESGR